MVFQPSNQRPYFEDELSVYVPNQQEQLIITLKVGGRADQQAGMVWISRTLSMCASTNEMSQSCMYQKYMWAVMACDI